MITIKKYANGRLYDTDNKQYVTKNQLSELIEGKEKIRVVLAKTGKDVTSSVVSSLPISKKVKPNSGKRLLDTKNAMIERVEGHKKWMAKQIGQTMDSILEMMSFPNKQQVRKLNADVRKLYKKIDDLQKRHAKAREKMKLEHQKEMKRLIQQYHNPTTPVETEPEVQTA